MNAHLVFIPLIILSLWVVYGAWFRGWAKKHYEIGFMPGPSNLRAYIWTFRGLTVVGLIMMITFYVLALMGK
jgi:hypothetical protein